MSTQKIIYTFTDEAPALATYSFLPIVQAFTKACGVEVETADISLAGRILAKFPEATDGSVPDALADLGALVKQPHANVIKLPNISASMPQLKAAVAELQQAGFKVPDYPDDPSNAAEEDIKKRFDKIKGSAVNPVLREGNSDRRAPRAVKNYAKKNPHSMGPWTKESKTHVAHMPKDDFFSNEKSVTMAKADTLRIELRKADGGVEVLKDALAVLDGEIVDASFMSKKALCAFLTEQIADAKTQGVLFSLHMKATMMKVSDPIIFGHAVRAFFSGVFEKHAAVLDEAGVNVNNGFGNLLAAIQTLPEDKRKEIEADIASAYASGPDIAMVNSDKGITNLHVPSDVIIDASIPAMIRTSGQMWNKAGELQDAKITIPDGSYAGLYEETVRYCIENGAFDPTTMGTVPNVGLMAQKAEEYGSHDKTFELAASGKVVVLDSSGSILMEHSVETGDIWRMCQVKDAPVRDWVQLALRRARATKTPVVFWLDKNRAHDAELIKKVERYIGESDVAGLEIEIKDVRGAARFTLERCGAGKDTIGATGNVLRDYLTDLFPILELGTSAKMLSVVPLMNGGGLFETGAGGSAPKHVQQFEKENHLRWDSLGEFLALAVSLDHLSTQTGNKGAKVLGDALDDATERLLETRKGPSRKVNELDNRGSHFYLAMYWAEALAGQKADADLAKKFGALHQQLAAQEKAIVAELNDAQGPAMDIGGYYRPDTEKAAAAMRPSATLNGLIDSL